MKDKQKQISYDDYLKAVGVLTVAHEQEKLLRSYVEVLSKLLGEEADESGFYNGHAADAVYGEYSIGELLGKLDLKVKKK